MIMRDAANKRSRRRGLTVVELLLALTITAIISLAISSMLFAVSHGTDSSNDMRALLLRQRLVAARLNAMIRSSHMVLATGSNHVVLWTHDANNSGTPNRSEVRYLEMNTVSGELWSYKTVWPVSMTTEQIEAADVEYDLTADFASLMPAFKGQASFPGERWATDLSGWVVTLNNIDPQLATLVSYRFSMRLTEATDFVIGAAALRNNSIVLGE